VTGASLRLAWPGCRNVRDVGGLPTTDGGAVRVGAPVLIGYGR
jgi:protein-tyrosine phosphatase